ncbi:hypothetical protein HPB47_006893 [Ixodes persulcatus]|uniref:Uncharacterized protein n=1 Tax=Ixodes persulcatus TaxID=34615 RepID=A0AC60P927_IXOPE|nr:hypothetical protein HPB47_006893 [Ixodes persulcatus]
MDWPPRSLDLTPCNCFLVWGYVKAQVYARRSRTIPELKKHRIYAFEIISEEMREAVFQDYERRLEKCIEVRGGHVELGI